MKRIISLLLVVCMTVLLFAGCSKKSDGVLIVGTNAEFPPFEYVNDEGEFDGFDIALMKEVGKKINMEVKIENMEFKGLIGALSSGKINCIAAGMTVDEERLLSCDFTETYFKSKQFVMVRKGDTSIKTAADLEGKKIAVQEGTSGDFIVTDDIKDTEVTRLKKFLDAVTELANGKVDAVVIDSKPAETFEAQNDKVEIVKDLVLAEEDYGIAVKKGNKELLDKIQGAINDLKADGTYDKLVEEYINK